MQGVIFSIRGVLLLLVGSYHGCSRPVRRLEKPAIDTSRHEALIVPDMQRSLWQSHDRVGRQALDRLHTLGE